MYLIVSRFQPEVDLIRKKLPVFKDAEVDHSPTPAKVKGNVVAGHLSLSLAALANQVIVIEYPGEAPDPRCSVAELEAAGAKLVAYSVDPLQAARYELHKANLLDAAKNLQRGDVDVIAILVRYHLNRAPEVDVQRFFLADQDKPYVLLKETEGYLNDEMANVRAKADDYEEFYRSSQNQAAEPSKEESSADG